MIDVSVVIPSYRSENLIFRTIASILEAGVLPENIYVIEDGVFDNTGEILKSNPGVNHIAYKENKGAPYARNLGLDRVETKYVMFIDSDDIVSKKLIKGLVESAKRESAEIVFGPWRLDGDHMRQGKIKQPPNLSTQDWVFNWINNECVPTCSVLWKTDKVKEIGGWNEVLKKNQDGELALRGLMNTKKLSVSTKGYSTYWQHNSKFRVSKASIEDRLFASNLIYDNIQTWMNKSEYLHTNYRESLGRYCCKIAWIAQAENLEDITNKWIVRAKKMGYEKKGYNRKTKILSSIFGFYYAVAIKSILNDQ